MRHSLKSTRPRAIAFFLALAAISGAPNAAPRLPTDPSEVLERLPIKPGDSVARELTDLRAGALAGSRKNPPDPLPTVLLAERYYDLAIARGDPRYIGYADAVMAPLAASKLPAVLAARGQLKQYRHDFEGALADFASALQADPDFAAAHAWRAAIFMVQANYSAARKECNALQALGRATLHGGCEGLALAYSGQSAAGFDLLKKTLTNVRDPGNRLWLLTRLAEVAAWRGQTREAEQFYRQALALGREDAYLLAAWADFLLDQQRPTEVIKALDGATVSDGLLLRQALANKQLRRPAAQSQIAALRDRFAAAKARQDTTHRAEEARFLLHLSGNAAEALDIAKANYAVQREPRDARPLLEAAIAVGSPAAARPVLDWLAASGFEDQALRKLAQAAATPSAAGQPGTQP